MPAHLGNVWARSDRTNFRLCPHICYMKLVPRLLEYDRFAKSGIRREDLEELMPSGEPISYATFVTGVFDLYGRIQGKSLVGDKTPRFARKIPTLHGLWPEAKFVHLIRDGRDVFLSILNWKKAQKSIGRFESWREDPVTATALWWSCTCTWPARTARRSPPTSTTSFATKP